MHVIDQIVKNYNHRYHSSIRATPAQGERSRNHDHVRRALSEIYHKNRLTRKRPKYKVDDWVRVVNVRGKFSRSYHQTHGEYMYQITGVHTNLPRPMYTLKDSAGEEQTDKCVIRQKIFFQHRLKKLVQI